jgi:type I restriction enzyme S subunit
LAEVIRGVTYKKEQAKASPSDGLLPLLRATNISQELDFDNLVYVPNRNVSDLQMHRQGDIVIAASSGSKAIVGKAAILCSDWTGTFGAFCAVARPHQAIAAKYLSYYMQTSQYRSYISACSAGVNINNLKATDLGSFELFLAPRREQDRIVNEIEKQFTRLDAATAALKRVQANLKRYRASVLKAACEGQLVSTEAELARKEGRDYEPADKLLQRILRERRARWEADTLAKMQASGNPPKDDHWKHKYKEPSAPDTSNLPPLPVGWCWAGLEQIARFQNGRPFPSSQYGEDGIRLIRPGNLHVSGRVVWDEKNTRCLPAPYAEDNSDLIVRGGELIMNLTAQPLRDEFLGRICITDEDEVSLLNQRLARITPVLIPPQFMLWTLKSWRFRRFVDKLNTGSLIQHMFTSQLAEFAVALPPIAEQQRISDAVDAQLIILNSQEKTLEITNARSSSLRRATLTAAFTGQLVPQDPNDEPASALLERIRVERASQPRQKATRNSKQRPGTARQRGAK